VNATDTRVCALNDLVVGWLVGRSVGGLVVVVSESVGGRRRIRTSVGYAGDFTDRSLWPLGHPPW
jgi:hypothetical protein